VRKGDPLGEDGRRVRFNEIGEAHGSVRLGLAWQVRDVGTIRTAIGGGQPDGEAETLDRDHGRRRVDRAKVDDGVHLERYDVTREE
jgi:hypothetical protein